MAFFRLIRPFDAIAIELSAVNTSHPNMPNVTGPMAYWIQVNDPRRRRIIRMFVKFQANTCRVTAKQNEIDSVSLLMSTPNREWIARLDITFLRRCYEIVRRFLLRR
jgi:hypothetical protein